LGHLAVICRCRFGIECRRRGTSKTRFGCEISESTWKIVDRAFWFGSFVGPCHSPVGARGSRACRWQGTPGLGSGVVGNCAQRSARSGTRLQHWTTQLGNQPGSSEQDCVPLSEHNIDDTWSCELGNDVERLPVTTTPPQAHCLESC
jgi:hypothetical protein